MSKLIIINGYAGAGKSTVAKQMGVEENYALIRQDYFLFAINTINPDVSPPAVEDYSLAINNMMSVTQNYMDVGRDIILEGALVSISQDDDLDVRDFIKLGESRGYDVKIVTLVANDETRLQREKERDYVVPKSIDKMLRSAIDEINGKIEGEVVIDTSSKSIDEVVSIINSEF